MPAPDLKTLLNFAPAFRSAAVSIANASGIEKAYADLGDDNKTTPYIEAHFILGDPTGHRYSIPGNRDPQANPYDAFNATLTFNAVTNRGTNGEQEEMLCSTIRAFMLQYRAKFTSELLPWYVLDMARPQRNTLSIIPEKNLNVTQLPYSIHFWIRPSAWPAWQ